MSGKDFFMSDREIDDNYLILFCTRCCLITFPEEILKGKLVNIFAEKVVRGKSMQIGPSFPAKSLSIYTKIFLRYLNNYFVIKKNKYFV